MFENKEILLEDLSFKLNKGQIFVMGFLIDDVTVNI